MRVLTATLCPWCLPACLQVADIVAKQRRIERQDKPTVEGVSFEHSAAGGRLCCTHGVQSGHSCRVTTATQPAQQAAASTAVTATVNVSVTTVMVFSTTSYCRRDVWMHLSRAAAVASTQADCPVLCCAVLCAAADSFQMYCQSALGFSIKRGGILYGTGACHTWSDSKGQAALVFANWPAAG